MRTASKLLLCGALMGLSGLLTTCDQDALGTDETMTEIDFRDTQAFDICTGEADIFLYPEAPSVVGPFTNPLGTVYGYPTQVETFAFFDPDRCSDFDDEDLVIPETNENVNITSIPYSLVNRHRSKNDCANADPRGGSVVFDFSLFTRVNSFFVWDTEERGYVSYYDANDQLLSFSPLPRQGDGEFCQVQVSEFTDPAEVAKMVIDFGGSGAVSDLCVTVDDPSEGIEPTPVPPAEYPGCTRDWKWWKKNKDQACRPLVGNRICDLDYIEILNMKTKGRDAILLLKELVAADLNTTCLGAPFSLIEDTWFKAFDELACQPFSPINQDVLLRLQHFNKGLIGPGQDCD